MESKFDVGAKLFFSTLIICLIAFVYFRIVPINTSTFIVGGLINIAFLGVNLYIGYRYRLSVIDSIIVGIMGCGSGIFLLFFATYTHFILGLVDTAIWIITPYILPTISMVEVIGNNIDLLYAVQVMVVNILLVIIGSSSKKLMNKLTH